MDWRRAALLPTIIKHKTKCGHRYMWANFQCFLPSIFLYFHPMVKRWLALLTEWISGGDTAPFNRYIVAAVEHISWTSHAYMHEIGCNEMKTIQGSRIYLVIFILPWSQAGITCVECCQDIRALRYNDDQRRRTARIYTSLYKCRACRWSSRQIQHG